MHTQCPAEDRSIVLACVFLAWAAVVHGQSPVSPDEFTAQADAAVSSLALQSDGRIVISGDFTNVNSQARPCMARLNADGTLDTSFDPAPDQAARALVVQVDGSILVGGRYWRIAGQERAGIARLLADGSLDTGFTPESDNKVYSLAVQADGEILVGGCFVNFGGQARAHLARLNPQGVLDSGFDPGANDAILCIALQEDGQIVVGGSFTNLAGQARNCLGRLKPDGSLDATFDPGIGGLVSAVAVQADGKIVVGGSFTNIGSEPRARIGRLNTDGTLDSGFNPGVDGNSVYLNSIALQADGKILFAGKFTNVAGEMRSNLARLNPDGSLDSSFNPMIDKMVNALGIQADGKIVIGGSFTSVNGCGLVRLARLNNSEPATQSLDFDGTALTWLRGGTAPEIWRAAFEVSTNATDWRGLGDGARIPGGWRLQGITLPANSRARARGFVLARSSSGWFVESYYGKPLVVGEPSSRTNIAQSRAIFAVRAGGSEPMSCQWLKNGFALSDVGNSSGAATSTLTLSNVLGNDAGSYSLVLSNAFGVVTSAVATLTVRDPAVSSDPTTQYRELHQDANFQVLGVGTAPISYRWWRGDTALPGANTASLTLTNVGAAEAGNYFVVLSNRYGLATSAVAVLVVNLVTLDPSFGASSDGEIYATVVQPDGGILVGGSFTRLDGQPSSCFARLNAGGILDSNFCSTGASSLVRSLALQPDGKVLVGGDFLSLGGQPRKYLGRLNADGSVDGSFDPSPDGTVSCLLLQPDGKVMLGGAFRNIGTEPRTRIARLNADGSVDPGFNVTVFDLVNCLTLQPDGKVLVGGWFLIVGTQARNRIARLNADGSVDLDFNPGADAPVSSLLIARDGKILVGGSFSALAGKARRYLGRLNLDGSLDDAFNPAPSNQLQCITLQADGHVLVGGRFTNIYGQARKFLARLEPDGSLDGSFDGKPDNYVNSLAIQADGKVVVGGAFTHIAGLAQGGLARLNNTGVATQTLGYDGLSVTWMRERTSPEVWRTCFEFSTNGADWSWLGMGSRINEGWRVENVLIAAEGILRARGFIAGGYQNGSCWFVESFFNGPWPIRLTMTREGQEAVVRWTGGHQPFEVQQCTNLVFANSWVTLETGLRTNHVRLPIQNGNLFLRVRDD